jgi:hypothetical protein
MTTPGHSTLAAGRWHQFTLATQLGNIGSEFERASRSFTANNESRFRAASDRLYELLNLSASDPKFSLVQRREITRLRESISETFFGSTQTEISRNGLSRYFYHFGVLARKQAAEKEA